MIFQNDFPDVSPPSVENGYRGVRSRVSDCRILYDKDEAAGKDGQPGVVFDSVLHLAQLLLWAQNVWVCEYVRLYVFPRTILLFGGIFRLRFLGVYSLFVQKLEILGILWTLFSAHVFCPDFCDLLGFGRDCKGYRADVHSKTYNARS